MSIRALWDSLVIIPYFIFNLCALSNFIYIYIYMLPLFRNESFIIFCLIFFWMHAMIFIRYI